MKEPEVTLELALEHGLTEEEFEKIKNILGRVPNFTELGCFSVMWSEHASYKNSIALLKKLPRSGKRLLVQAGEENAGLVDIGDGFAIAFKIESHNHPSAVEPYQGAATGVGGILRDIFTMGARPIAALDSLRFGNLENPKIKYLLNGVIKGIGDYGNCFGVPTVAGEVYFEEAYTDNCLVNAMAVGVVKTNRVAKAVAKGEGNPVFIVGSSTGRDGIHGATFASVELTEESESRRSNVQVGDPFAEKLLLEATLEIIKKDLIVGIQDMGAAGIICSTSEMSARGKSGMRINLDLVPLRESDMTAYEILLSESQERMLVVGKKGCENEIKKVFEKWDLQCVQIGEVIDEDLLEFYKEGKLVAKIPASALVLGGGAPVYYREIKKPEYIDKLTNKTFDNLPEINDLNSVLIKLLSSPNITNKSWIYHQYDYTVGTNTVIKPGCDASVLRIKKTNKAIAVKTDCNGRYVYLNPRRGTMIAVAEAARNVACTGAIPIAITNCLNFGNPYDPEIYWQFSEAIEGMKEACIEFDTPVTGGNVSFYNESKNYTVYPTPVIGMLGLIEDVKFITSSYFKDHGDLIYLIGETKNEIGGSEFLKTIFNRIEGEIPEIDLKLEKKTIDTLLKAIRSGLIKSAHDVSDGGLAVALAECCVMNPKKKVGAEISLKIDFRKDFYLFSESQSRFVVTVDPEDQIQFEELFNSTGIKVEKIGKVGGNRLKINDLIDLSIQEIDDAYFNSLKRSMEGK
ncbi:MAG: phosphoribosylformylglycinamidine synthase subunit PurL [Ignavibacteria bacterium]|jgi:phosphoribosylformylglycinamidine synthase|nr:phosphoribosylformylglycinamidine synthase subunit PurL [Ignavibacteria bacterium]MDH7528657.1 phosphoribosylformylglycinamidine synthase subunit PurL [Ignavibacteria bacterium]NPV11128.1 phosphoribosylformylglycinamidine synthase subunit PurL [Ignavibacteria bacterium]